MASGSIAGEDRKLVHNNLEPNGGIRGGAEMVWKGSLYMASSHFGWDMKNLGGISIKSANKVLNRVGLNRVALMPIKRDNDRGKARF